MKFTLQLQEILDNLNQQNWIKYLIQYSNIYIVGGCVRDAFLNKSIKDVDIVIEGLSLDKISDILSFYGKVDVVGESFSVIKFKPFNHNGEPYDIAIPRQDRKISEGHKGFEIITENININDDLKRRDFTINSIAINISAQEILDPFNGLTDLQNKIIRVTDENVFIDDALRILRGIQFSARFNFQIEENTKQLMKNNFFLLNEISGERILEEFEKILNKNGNIILTFILLYETNLDKALFGHKFHLSNFLYLNEYEQIKYDKLSFYYILCTLGDVVPSEFYSKRLKGNIEITKGLKIIEKIQEFQWTSDEQFIKWNILKFLKESNLIENCVILPSWFKDVIQNMKQGLIPMKLGDVQISGNDIIDLNKNITGPEIGKIIEKIYKDALVNKFLWKDRTSCLKYLESLILI